MTVKAGIQAIDISPSKPMFLLGYPHVPRISTGIHDPLYATALYLSNDREAIFNISVDVLMISHWFIRQCREEISAITGVHPNHILISTTHTHSAPVTVDLLLFKDDPVVPPIDPEYMAIVKQSIIEAATTAFQNAQPSSIAHLTIDIDGVGTNRHHPQGPHDPQAGLLIIKKTKSDNVTAISIVYSMHPTVLHEDTSLVTADFPGFTRQLLNDYYPEAKILYQTGPSGNLSPRYHVKSQTFAEAERLGNHLGYQILKEIKGLDKNQFNDSIKIDAVNTFINLPFHHFPQPAAAEMKLLHDQEAYAALKGENAPHGPLRTAEVTIFGTEQLLKFSHMQETGELELIQRKYEVIEIQALRIGDICLLGIPGEMFVEYSLEIKRSTSPTVFVISLANGELQGYIVTPEAEGYEANFSLFEPQAGKIIVDQSVKLIQELFYED
jgi:neutral ceramidase